MRGLTFLSGPSSSDLRNAGKISIFLSLLSLSLSFSLYPFSSSFSFPVWFSSFCFFLLLYSYPPNSFSYVCSLLISHFHFLFLFFLIFFLSFIFSSISFSLLAFLFDPHQTNWSSGETSSPLSLLDTCHSLNFSLIFFNFLSFFILHLTLDSM